MRVRARHYGHQRHVIGPITGGAGAIVGRSPAACLRLTLPRAKSGNGWTLPYPIPPVCIDGRGIVVTAMIDGTILATTTKLLTNCGDFNVFGLQRAAHHLRGENGKHTSRLHRVYLRGRGARCAQ